MAKTLKLLPISCCACLTLGNAKQLMCAQNTSACANIFVSSPFFSFSYPSQARSPITREDTSYSCFSMGCTSCVASGGHDSASWSGICLQAMYLLLLLCLCALLNDPYMPYLKRVEKGSTGSIACLSRNCLAYISQLPYFQTRQTSSLAVEGTSLEFHYLLCSTQAQGSYSVQAKCAKCELLRTYFLLNIQENVSPKSVSLWIATIVRDWTLAGRHRLYLQLAIKIGKHALSALKSLLQLLQSHRFRCSSGRSSVVLCPGYARIPLQSSSKIQICSIYIAIQGHC